MTADVKLSHYLMRRVVNTQIIQKIISKHHPLCECFTVLRLELQYYWTPPQIFICGYRVLQLLCHNVEGAYYIKCSQK